MTVQTHELHDEFPQYREQIHEIKMRDKHFARLLEEYHKATREIKRIEEELETPSDAYAEELKKKRLKLKDELFAILKKGAA
jgi:uncharacterized protein YdcH (DUF465 family)